ncbi:Uncharacterized protein APZ42_011601 [Daphnia magna]|uniref:Uncharacterized protein n=1 Tax=Daphnia magna TaxID=35525 RepID=A0A162STA7_9CRUS|nr:Uncharacterized protein APZ42_011601 [Daphnia magna]
MTDNENEANRKKTTQLVGREIQVTICLNLIELKGKRGGNLYADVIYFRQAASLKLLAGVPI